MDRPFDSFVILAEMRTGSNFLESNLNEIEGLHSYGEVFNPYLICKPEQTDLFGVTLAERDADPLRMIEIEGERHIATEGKTADDGGRHAQMIEQRRHIGDRQRLAVESIVRR